MKFNLFLKSIIDIIGAIIALVVFSPLWIAVSAIIKLTSRGPAIFVQKRPGKNKELFKIYKFRTMIMGSEKMIKGQEVFNDDPRITNVGKFLRRTKIDEAPQILNVLSGQMSLVGPRPERIASLENYDDEILKRLNMKPGMTGLAQVSGNIHLDLQQRYKYDVFYVENFSLLLDLKILFRTIGVIFLGEKQYKDKPLIDMEKG